MKVAVFSTKPYDKTFLKEANPSKRHEFTFIDVPLGVQTVKLAEGFPCVCVFVNDALNGEVLAHLHEGGTRFIALRCAGFNNVELFEAERLDMLVARVPAYSPHSIAEHTIGLMLALSRKICRAYTRTRDGNFSLDGLIGYDIHGKTVGIIGTGKIGAITAGLAQGFGTRVLACDMHENQKLIEAGIEYVSQDELFAASDVISLHCPLTDESYHLIGKKSIPKMKPGVMILNTSRGALVDTESMINALKSGHVGAFGMDVYEEEANLFFEDYSSRVIQDDQIARILSFPNVVVTSHQAYFTVEAMEGIAQTTLANIDAFEQNTPPKGLINWDMIKPK